MVNYKYDIEILIDKITREGIYAYYLKEELEKKGFTVKIDHQDFYTKPNGYDFFLRTKEKARYVMTPSFNVIRTKNILSKCIRQKSTLIINHSEQLFPPIFDKEKLNTNLKETYNSIVGYHLVWGELYKDKLINLTKTNEENIKIVGNFKLDLIKRSLNNNKSNESKKGKSEIKNILVVSNFLLGDYNSKSWKKFKKAHQIKSALPINEIMSDIRTNFLQEIKKICLHFPNKNFYVRPHPGENYSIYNEYLGNIKNVFIKNDSEFMEDVLIADFVIMHTSSSIFELIVSGKQFCSLDVGRLPDNFAQPPVDIFNWKSTKEVKEILNRGQDMEYESSINRSAFEYAMASTNIGSLDKNVEILEEILNKPQPGFKFSIFIYYLHFTYLLEAFTKDLILKIGYNLKKIGVSNFIYSFAKNHIKRRIASMNFIPKRYTTRSNSFRKKLSKMKNHKVYSG